MYSAESGQTHFKCLTKIRVESYAVKSKKKKKIICEIFLNQAVIGFYYFTISNLISDFWLCHNFRLNVSIARYIFVLVAAIETAQTF